MRILIIKLYLKTVEKGNKKKLKHIQYRFLYILGIDSRAKGKKKLNFCSCDFVFLIQPLDVYYTQFFYNN